METISETKQPLLHRTVAIYSVSYDGATPKRIDLVKQIAKKTKGTVVVTHIYPVSGQQAALVHAHIYHDDTVSAAVERKNLLAKQQPKAAAEPEAQ